MSVALLTHEFTATGQSAAVALHGKANVLIQGGVGTVELQKSFDGVNFFPVSKNSNGDVASYSPNSDTAFNGTVEEPETGVVYRFSCTAYTSGTIACRMSR